MARRRKARDERSGGFWTSRRTGKGTDGEPDGEPDGGVAGSGLYAEPDPRAEAVNTADVESTADESTGPTTCDWELHYWTGVDWEVLRAAPFPARKCCAYKVRVETKVTRHEQAVHMGPDVSADRRFVPDLGFDWRAMDLDVATSTVSGPRDHDDWVPVDPHRFDPDATTDTGLEWPLSHGEPPGVAVRVAHDETTRIEVLLESGCTQPRNTFSSSGDSSLAVTAGHECTNHEPGTECPVDLGTQGWQWGEVWGALDWIVHDVHGIDSDELERLIAARRALDPEQRSITPARTELHRTWHQHGHDSGDQMAIEGGDYDAGHDTRQRDRWTTWVASEVQLDTAQFVPASTWPTTGKVSTRIEQHLTHTIKLAAEMQQGACSSSGCCTGTPGHVCNCAPEFELKLDSTGSHIVVDGSSFAIERVPARADRDVPPVVTAPPTYEAWRLT